MGLRERWPHCPFRWGRHCLFQLGPFARSSRAVTRRTNARFRSGLRDRRESRLSLVEAHFANRFTCRLYPRAGYLCAGDFFTGRL